MKYILTNQPQKINETKGEIQNVSVRHTIVLAAGTSIPSVGTSTITVRPGESYPFKTILGEALYAWIINANDDETLEVSVINFPSEGEGGDTDISAIETEIINQGKQLQNCFELPHPSLDYALFVKNGELKEWSKDGKSKLQTSEQVGNGDLATHSLGGKGLNGVIAENNLNIGAGYENLIKNTNSGSSTHTKDGYIFTWICTTDTVTSKYITIESSLAVPNTDYTLSWEVLEGEEHFDYGVLFYTSFNPQVQSALPKDTITGTSIADPIGNCGILYMKQNALLGSKVVIKVSMTKTSSAVPYIKDSIPDGRCVLDVDWTSADSSFIIGGTTYVESVSGVHMGYICSDTADTLHERVYTTDDVKKLKNFLVSSIYQKAVYDDGSEAGISLSTRGMTSGILNLTYPRTSNAGNDSIGFFLRYSDPNLIEEILKSELEKFKAGKVKLNDMGFVENIPNSKKKMDKLGVVKTHIKVTIVEKDEDIYFAMEGDMYEVIDSTGSSYTTIGVNGAITPGSKIKNVAGYVVTDDLVATYPLKLRMVK